MEERPVKNRLRRTLLASSLIAGIVFTIYGVFARAQSGTKFASVPARTPVKGSARTAAVQPGNRQPGASQSPAVKGAIPMVYASYSKLADGNYVGNTVYAYYGYVKVEAIVQNGNLADVRVLEHPNDNGTSRYINSVALPYLVQEAVQSQNAQINLISGATFTSMAFVKSLGTALAKATSA